MPVDPLHRYSNETERADKDIGVYINYVRFSRKKTVPALEGLKIK